MLSRRSLSPRIGFVVLALAAFAFVGVPAGQAAPKHTISRYVSTTDVSRWYDLGCSLGQAVANGSRPLDGTVFLAFGRPSYNGTSYGTIIYNNSFRTTAQIRQVAYNYGYGYYVCAPQGAFLEISIGTTNLGGYTTYNHGQAWANMVDATNNMYINNCCIADYVVASGASDMELDWNSPSATRTWGNGYNAAAQYWYNNFGDAAGCPPYGSCNNGWTQDDIWYVSWGNPSGMAVPADLQHDGGKRPAVAAHQPARLHAPRRPEHVLLGCARPASGVPRYGQSVHRREQHGGAGMDAALQPVELRFPDRSGPPVLK
jgi:hypothetical protein